MARSSYTTAEVEIKIVMTGRHNKKGVWTTIVCSQGDAVDKPNFLDAWGHVDANAPNPEKLGFGSSSPTGRIP